jgi:hypothetical protein
MRAAHAFESREGQAALGAFGRAVVSVHVTRNPARDEVATPENAARRADGVDGCAGRGGSGGRGGYRCGEGHRDRLRDPGRARHHRRRQALSGEDRLDEIDLRLAPSKWSRQPVSDPEVRPAQRMRERSDGWHVLD